MPTTDYDHREQLPNVWLFNVKIEKMLTVGPGRFYLSADIFNVFNSNVLMRKRDVSYGTFYYDGSSAIDDYSGPSGTSGANNELMNPLVMRLGMRFQF